MAANGNAKVPTYSLVEALTPDLGLDLTGLSPDVDG
jgi:hypothetical protein